MVPALASNVEHRNLLLQRPGGVLSAEDAGKVAGVTRQAIDKRRRGNAILAVREGSDWKYPACQFRDGEVLAGIAEVVRGLADQGAWATLDGEGGGLPGELGAVAPGYQAADLCLLNEDTTYLTPLNRPVASFVFSENGASVDTVIVGGEIVVQSGQCSKIDERAIRRRARSGRRRLSGQPGAEQIRRRTEPSYRRCHEGAVPGQSFCCLWLRLQFQRAHLLVNPGRMEGTHE